MPCIRFRAPSANAKKTGPLTRGKASVTESANHAASGDEKRKIFQIKKMDNGNGHIERPTDADLERAKKTAIPKRRQAWELLKQTRNAKYVALRYGYPIETMEKALEQIPDDSGVKPDRSPSAETAHSTIKRAVDVLPETLRKNKPED